MTLSIPKRFLIITAAVWLLALLFFTVFNIIEFAPKEIDPYFRTGWIFNRSLLLFLNYLIPVQCTAVIYTFSVFYPKTRTDSGLEILTSKNFSSLVTIVIVILLSLTAVFFAGTEILKPKLHDKLDTYAYLTQTGRAHLEQAQTAADDGRLFDAETAVKKYLAIKPEAEDGLVLYRTIAQRLENQYSIVDNGEEPDTGNTPPLDLSYDDALSLAQRYLDREDYYSAYYYSRIAAGLSDRSGEAAGISSEAWTRLSETAPSREEKAEYRLFSQKKRGTDLSLLQKNRSMPITFSISSVLNIRKIPMSVNTLKKVSAKPEN